MPPIIKNQPNQHRKISTNVQGITRGRITKKLNVHTRKKSNPASSSHQQIITKNKIRLVNKSPTISEVLAKLQDRRALVNSAGDETDIGDNGTPKNGNRGPYAGKTLIAIRSAGGLRLRIRRKLAHVSTPRLNKKGKSKGVQVKRIGMHDSDEDDVSESDDDHEQDSGNDGDGDHEVEADRSSCNDSETESEEEVSDDDDIDETDVKNGAKDNRWLREQTFATKELLSDFLARESWWSYRTRNQCSEGMKVLYRCNRVKRCCKVQCEASIYVVESTKFVDKTVANGTGSATSANTNYTLYRKNALHTHRRSPEYKQHVSERVKELILNHYKNGRKPKKISYSILDDDKIPLKEKPSYKQVIRVITNFKNEGSGAAPLTMSKLTDVVKSHMQLPNGDDEAFIVQFERSPKDFLSFCLKKGLF